MYQQVLEARSNEQMGIDRVFLLGLDSFHISVTLPSDDRVEELFSIRFKQFRLSDLTQELQDYLSDLGLIKPNDDFGNNSHFSFGELSGAHWELSGLCLLVFNGYWARLILLNEERMKVLRSFREQLRDAHHMIPREVRA